MPQIDDGLEREIAKKVADVYAEAQLKLWRIVSRRLAQGVDEAGWAETKLAEIVDLRADAQRIVRALSEEALGDLIRDAGAEGAAEGAAEIRSLSIEGPTVRTDTAAVDAIARETVVRIEATHTAILRTIEDAYRDVIAETTAAVASGVDTTREAMRAALTRFADRGITGFVDRAGRHWTLESYVEMATRTGAGRAQVRGHLDQYAAAGEDLVIVSDHTQECRLCRPWEGRILSISGESRRFPSVDDATRAGLLHPNCRHDLRLYVRGLTKPPPRGSTADPVGDRLRQRQREMERNIRKWKRRDAVALTDADSARARAKVREWQARLRDHVDTHDLKRLRYRERVRV